MAITDVTVHPKDGGFVVAFGDQSGNGIAVTLYTAASPGLTSFWKRSWRKALKIRSRQAIRFR
jgi:hypothetical protein